MKIRVDQLGYIPAVLGSIAGGVVLGYAWVLGRLEIVDRAREIEEDES